MEQYKTIARAPYYGDKRYSVYLQQKNEVFRVILNKRTYGPTSSTEKAMGLYNRLVPAVYYIRKDELDWKQSPYLSPHKYMRKTQLPNPMKMKI